MAVRTEKERSVNSLGTLLPELGHFPLFHAADATVADGFLHEAVAVDPEEELAAKLATAHALGVAKGSEDVRAAMVAENCHPERKPPDRHGCRAQDMDGGGKRPVGRADFRNTFRP